MYNFRLCIYNFVIYPVISNYDLFFLSLYEKKKGIDFIVKRKYFSLKMFEFYLYIYIKNHLSLLNKIISVSKSFPFIVK